MVPGPLRDDWLELVGAELWPVDPFVRLYPDTLMIASHRCQGPFEEPDSGKLTERVVHLHCPLIELTYVINDVVQRLLARRAHVRVLEEPVEGGSRLADAVLCVINRVLMHLAPGDIGYMDVDPITGMVVL